MQIIDYKIKKGLVELILDDGAKSPGILKSLFFDSGYTRGSEIDADTLYDLCYRSDLKRAKSRALYYVSRQAMSSGALFERLCRNFMPKAAQAAVDFLKENGFIDDVLYAERLAEKYKSEGRSKRETAVKMAAKGIDRALVDDALREMEFDETEAVVALLRGKYSLKLSQPNGEQKVFAALMRRGFSASDIKRAVKIINGEENV